MKQKEIKVFDPYSPELGYFDVEVNETTKTIKTWEKVKKGGECMVFCPNCVPEPNTPRYKTWMRLKKDEQNIPETYKCPKCGHQQPLTLKQKIMEIIYGAKWDFGGEEVDDYFIDNEDEIMELLVKVIKRPEEA